MTTKAVSNLFNWVSCIADRRRQLSCVGEGVYSDATQLNSTSSSVELRRYKRAFKVQHATASAHLRDGAGYLFVCLSVCLSPKYIHKKRDFIEKKLSNLETVYILTTKQIVRQLHTQYVEDINSNPVTLKSSLRVTQSY